MLSSQLHLVAEPETLPFSLEDASRPETEVEDKGFNNVLLKTRLDHRILDLRVCLTGRIMSWLIMLFYTPDDDESGYLQASSSDCRLISGIP